MDIINAKMSKQIYFRKIYGYVAAAILLAALSSYLTIALFGPVLMQFSGWLLIGMLVAQLILVFLFARITVKSTMGGIVSLGLFSILEGVSLSPVLYMTSSSVVMSAFISSSVLFAVLSVLGYVSHLDVSRWGAMLFGTTIAILIASLINVFFIKTTMFGLIVSVVAIIVFSLWTFYDTRNLNNAYASATSDDSLTTITIIGALSLFLDFINLFVNLLSIFTDFDS